ncbi:MAG: ferritin family protein [Thermodesulfobacteriota bacterium]|jgi:rubrerythrin
MSFATLREIIQLAINKEKDAQTFYRSASSLAKYPGMSSLFLELAEEEEKHRNLLEALPDPLNLPERSQSILDLKISDYLVDLKFYKEMKYQEVMILAMKNEERSLKFYRAWETKTQDPAQKKLFSYLADQEAQHKYRLESVYDEKILD